MRRRGSDTSSVMAKDMGNKPATMTALASTVQIDNRWSMIVAVTLQNLSIIKTGIKMSFWYRSSIQKVGRGVEKRRKRSFSAEIENLIGAQQKKICAKHLSGKTASTYSKEYWISKNQEKLKLSMLLPVYCAIV